MIPMSACVTPCLPFSYSFAHYIIGEIVDEHTRQDILDAKSVGLDAFALNYSKSSHIDEENGF